MSARILIIDDDPLMCDLLQMALRREGYDADTVYSGVEALDYLTEHGAVDLILLDIMMADLDGFDVLERLKAEERWRDIPVVILTARTDAPSRQQGMAGGAVRYLTKPIMPEALAEHVRAALAQHHT